MPPRPPPWTVEALDGGFKIVDSHGKSLAYVYGHADKRDAGTAKGLTLDEARPPRRALPIRLVLEGSDPAFIASKQKYLPRTWWRRCRVSRTDAVPNTA